MNQTYGYGTAPIAKEHGLETMAIFQTIAGEGHLCSQAPYARSVQSVKAIRCYLRNCLPGERVCDTDGRDEHFGNRFDYGELRLGRLNMIVTLCQGNVRGYMVLDTSYRSYFEPFLSLMTLLVFGFLSVSLSAFQVTMGYTNRPQAVNVAGFVFAVATLFIVGVTFALPSLWFSVIFVHNTVFALKPQSKANARI